MSDKLIAEYIGISLIYVKLSDEIHFFYYKISERKLCICFKIYLEVCVSIHLMTSLFVSDSHIVTRVVS